MVVFQKVTRLAFECDCGWCGCPIEVGDRILYDDASVGFCSPECAANSDDDQAARAEAGTLRKLPGVGCALSRGAEVAR